MLNRGNITVFFHYIKIFSLMKQVIFILIFAFTANYTLSQSLTISPPIFRHQYDVTTIDSGNIRILYALNAIDINDTQTYDDIQRLDIGSKFSKYYSSYVYQGDSLKKDFVKKHPNVKSIPNNLGEDWKKKGSWSLHIWSDYIKDFSKNVFTEYANMPHGAIPDYQYSEELPIQKWNLHDETITIAGHLCRKATCRFRGRNFVAWYATDISVSNGPWKFGGLSGLILKLYDNDRYYVFECIKIEFHAKKFPLFLFDEKRYQQTERTKLRQLEKDIYKDYFKVGGVTVTTKDGSPVKFTPLPYHPLELE